MTRQSGRPLRRARRRRPSERAPLVAGLVVSALAHIAVVVLYPFMAGERPDGDATLVRPAVRSVSGMRSLRIVVAEASEVGDPSDPVEIRADRPDIEAEAPDLTEDFEFFLPGRRPSAAEILRIGQGDARLWQPVDPEALRPTPEEVLRLRIAAAIEASNDSAFAEAERLAQSMDWTHTDDEGRKWGVSPGRIHLGGVEIPLPFGFGPPPDYNGDQADWAYRMADIDRAAGTLAARMSWRERAEAMRRRREARRAEEQADPDRAAEVKPDTTGASMRR